MSCRVISLMKLEQIGSRSVAGLSTIAGIYLLQVLWAVLSGLCSWCPIMPRVTRLLDLCNVIAGKRFANSGGSCNIVGLSYNSWNKIGSQGCQPIKRRRNRVSKQCSQLLSCQAYLTEKSPKIDGRIAVYRNS